MLELRNITKTYVTGDLKQDALKNVSVNFRKSEFVSILGHSGSGKTTMLNIIGGLDQYTSGDLVINGVSTQQYRDRDWDVYRNHSVGFVFQSYNLIPHQTVLANVELALTLSGVTKKERRRRAREALDKVGLADQVAKKPNQLSGGQMQRVAIARALINDPEILLADEPTGALDSDTSVQVMELLKEISADRLVIMVTHNGELADSYSTRIVRLVDGEITDDTNPYEQPAAPAAAEKISRRAVRARSMSFATAFSLSTNNLLTKKARTVITSFAGSIGIMGIALILSVSTGFQKYIDQIQEDTLSTYPLTIMSETADMSSMMMSVADAAGEIEDSDSDLTEQQMMATMFAQIGTNNIAAFKEHFEAHESELEGCINAIKYGYNLSPQIYSSDTEDGVLKVNPSSLFSAFSAASSFSVGGADVFSEMLDNRALLDEQYDVLSGRWAAEANELVLVLTSRGALSDYVVYALGLRDQSELDDMVSKIMNGEPVEITSEPMTWSYDDFVGMSFKLVSASDYYRYNEDYSVWEDMTDDGEYMRKLVESGEELTIVGIVCPKEGVSASALSAGIVYTPALTQKVIDNATSARIVADQLENPDVDVFTGRTFEDIKNDEGEGLDFNDMISIDTDMLSSAFGMNVSQSQIQSIMTGYMASISSSITTDTSAASSAFLNTLDALCTGALNKHIADNGDPAALTLADAPTVASAYMATDEATQALASLASAYGIPAATFAQIYTPLVEGAVTGYVTAYAVGSGSDPSSTAAPITASAVDAAVDGYVTSAVIAQTAASMGKTMTEAAMQSSILGDVSALSSKLISAVAGSFSVDEEKIAKAFNFSLDEEELTRLMQAYMTSSDDDLSADANLATLGYADTDEPTSMSIYLVDFDGKEKFKTFIGDYNAKMEADGLDEYVINYTDITGILMSSVKTIVDSVSYVLIAFVAISLVVSSIMIGVITFISVLERTKEIGILRAVGASKKDISRVFNAETIIVGLLAGLIGIGTSLLLLIPINMILHTLTGVASLNAVLPAASSVILIAISVILTFISGLIPSGAAARKNPVEALRTE